MAKFSIEVDTETGSLSVSVNGTNVDDVDSVSVYRYKNYDGDGYSVSANVCTCTEGSDGLRTYTNMSAKNSNEGKKAIKEGRAIAEKYPELVVVDNKSGIETNIAKLFKAFKPTVTKLDDR